MSTAEQNFGKKEETKEFIPDLKDPQDLEEFITLSIKDRTWRWEDTTREMAPGVYGAYRPGSGLKRQLESFGVISEENLTKLKELQAQEKRKADKK